MTKHSPAPWFANLEKYTGHLGINILSDNNDSIANVYLNKIDTAWGKVNYIERPENSESKANANLIAAAPELLEALELMLERGRDLGDSYYDADDDYSLGNISIFKKAYEAIKKAKGGIT